MTPLRPVYIYSTHSRWCLINAITSPASCGRTVGSDEHGKVSSGGSNFILHSSLPVGARSVSRRPRCSGGPTFCCAASDFRSRRLPPASPAIRGLRVSSGRICSCSARHMPCTGRCARCLARRLSTPTARTLSSSYVGGGGHSQTFGRTSL